MCETVEKNTIDRVNIVVESTFKVERLFHFLSYTLFIDLNTNIYLTHFLQNKIIIIITESFVSTPKPNNI